jgi:hypothetical protein
MARLFFTGRFAQAWFFFGNAGVPSYRRLPPSVPTKRIVLGKLIP